MNSMLINLIFFASAIVLAHGRDISECDSLSRSVMHMIGSHNETVLEYIQQNCPSEDIVRHILYVTSAQTAGGLDVIYPNGQKEYRIYNEQKEEQANWLAEANAKVAEYYFELVNIVRVGPSETATGKAIEYPSSSAIDELLNEVDRDNKSDGSVESLLWTQNDNEGVVKVVDMLNSMVSSRASF